jgi:hypothetical protein
MGGVSGTVDGAVLSLVCCSVGGAGAVAQPPKKQSTTHAMLEKKTFRRVMIHLPMLHGL